MYPSTWNSSNPVITQFNRLDTDGTPLTTVDGDGNVLFLPGDGDPSQVDFGIVTVTDAAQDNGSSFSSAARTRTTGADGTWAGAGRRRRDFYNALFGTQQSNHAVLGATGFAAPKFGASDCHPCPGGTASTKWMMTQVACAFGETPEDILVDANGDQLWEYTITGAITWTVNGRWLNSSTIANNGVGATFTLAENENMNGGPGGVLADYTLEDDLTTQMCNAWIKFLAPVQPPSTACGSAARGWDSLLVTGAGVVAGDFPTPLGG